jgi:hypothetical protein
MKAVSGWFWCHRCGHRAEGAGLSGLELAAGAPREHRATGRQSELALAVRLLPVWVWVLFAGLAVVAGVSFAVDRSLPLPSRARAIWSTAQFFLGLVSLLAAGVWVSQYLRLSRESFSLLDLLLPDRLWPMAFKSLPATRWQVCTAGWSIAAMLCAAVWVGGWTYWFPTTSRPVAAGTLKKSFGPAANSDDGGGLVDPDESLVGANSSAAATAAAPKTEVTRCVIVGYTVRDGQLTGLVTARDVGGELHFTGVVPLAEDQQLRDDLMARFTALKAEAPIFPDLNVHAVWLRPQLSCEVEAAVEPAQPKTASKPEGPALLKEPKYKGLVFPKQPQPVRVAPPADAPPGPAPAPPPPLPAPGAPAPKSPDAKK